MLAALFHRNSPDTKPFWRKLFWRIPLYLALVCLLISIWLAWQLTGDMHAPVVWKPHAGLFEPQNLQVTAEDGVVVSGWYWPGKPEQAAVVLCHGVGANRTQMLDQAAMLVRAGYAALVFDFRNHGISGGDTTTYGHAEQRDVRAMAAEITRRSPRSPVVLWGLSMGAASLLLAAPTIPGLAGAIAESPFDSMPETFRHHNDLYFPWPTFPVVDLTLWVMSLKDGYDPWSVSPIAAVAKSPDIPMLFVAGREDRRMPPALVRRVADAHAGQTSFFIGEGSHAVIFQASGRTYRERVLRFLELFN